jgi:hypothetical protein
MSDDAWISWRPAASLSAVWLPRDWKADFEQGCIVDRRCHVFQEEYVQG